MGLKREEKETEKHRQKEREGWRRKMCAKNLQIFNKEAGKKIVVVVVVVE
jgi:hypothetical protein